MEQWTVGNETYAASFDDPEDALGRGYGIPTPIAFDLEWYATAAEQRLDAQPDMSTGYEQAGVVHGSIEILGEPAGRARRGTRLPLASMDHRRRDAPRPTGLTDSRRAQWRPCAVPVP